jgi:type II secretory pathway component GspD/PulD (secretin)
MSYPIALLLTMFAFGSWTTLFAQPGVVSSSTMSSSTVTAPTSVKPKSKRQAIRDSIRTEWLRTQNAKLSSSSSAPMSAGDQTQPPMSSQPLKAPLLSSSAKSPIPVSSSANLAKSSSISNGSIATSSSQSPKSQDPGLSTIAPVGEGLPPVAKPIDSGIAKSWRDLPISDTLRLEALNVRGTEIKDLLQGMALQFGLNLVLSPEVQGPVTVNFNQIALKQAIWMVAQENGYQIEVQAAVMRVSRPKPVVVAPIVQNDIQFVNNRLSMDVKDIELADVVRKLVQVTNKNLLLDRSAKGAVTVYLKDLEFDKAIKILAQTNDLQIRESEGVSTLYRAAWAQPEAPKQGGGAAIGARGVFVEVKDSLVQLDVQGASLSQVVQALVQQANLNAVLYGNLQGTVTARLRGVSLNDALKFVFRESQSTFWFNNNILFVGPLTMQGGGNSQLIKMKYLRAEAALEALPNLMTKNSTLKVIKGLNGLMVLGSYEDIDAIRRYVEQIDQPVPMILIEALVVDVDLDKVRDYGLNLFLGQVPKAGAQEALYPNVSQVFNRNQAQSFLDGIPGFKDVISLPQNFVGQIRALEQEKTVKIHSRPLIATLNGETANITIGQTQYYLLKTQTDVNQGSGTVSNRVTENFTQINANVSLTVTPFVTGEGEITCEIIPDFSEPEGSFSAETPPTLNHRKLKSNVKLRDGETIVLGGLVKNSKQQINTQVPFLGSIPYLGWLFKNSNTVTSRSQLMIFVTPKVFYGSEARVNVDKELERLGK